MGLCIDCALFKNNFQAKDFKETLITTNNQFEDYRRKFENKIKKLEKTKNKLIDLNDNYTYLLSHCESESVNCSYLLSECNKESVKLIKAQKSLEKKVEKETIKLHEIQMKLLQSTKLATIGRFSAGIAHEVINPLTGILNCIRNLLEDSDIEGKRREYLELTLEGLLRIENTIGHILSFSGRHDFKPRLTDINRVLEEALAFARLCLIEKKIVLKENLTKSLPKIMIDPFQIQQVFMNVIGNAIDALSKEGNLFISTSTNNGNVEIIFNDNGKGIKQERLENIYDPFYTTKETYEGTGLDFVMSYNIIKQHKGTLVIKSKENKGTLVTITLPLTKRKNVSEENINS